MSATAYEDKSVYAKFLKSKISSECSGCGDCGEPSSDCTDPCACCPPGLVEVQNSEGRRIACLTPNDAELYNTNNATCQEGYLMLYKIREGLPDVRIGCVSEAAFSDMYTQINPA